MIKQQWIMIIQEYLFNFMHRSKLLQSFQRLVNKSLVRFFVKLGSLVAKKWPYFVVLPFLISTIALCGLWNLELDTDSEKLALPTKGKWSRERSYVDKLFKWNSEENFDPVRMTSLGQYVNIIIKSNKNGENILNPRVWEEIKYLDQIVTNERLYYKEKQFNFYDICTKYKGSCFTTMFPISPVILSYIGSVVKKSLSDQKYRRYTNLIDMSLEVNLGNAIFNKEGYLESAEAISLSYWLRNENEDDLERAREWERRISQIVMSNSSRPIEVTFFSARTPSDEMQKADEKMKPLVIVSGGLMVSFVVAISCSTDAVRGKLLLSLCGILSVLLATGSAFGILIFCNEPFIGINYATLFLMLGIGIDDMFVFLAGWRMTSIHDSVERRLKHTYGHCCVSVTITSLTNVIAFIVGSCTGITSIRIFSIYSCLSSFFTYFYFLTFFGGAMAAFGQLEKNQRHSLFFFKVKAKSEIESDYSCLNRMFLTGGISASDPTNPLDNEPHPGMVFFREVAAKVLSLSFSKYFICLLYVIYLGIALFGIFNLEQEIRPDRISFQKLTTKYFEDFDHYFSGKISFAQIIFTQEIQYSNDTIKKKIVDLHRNLEELPFVNERYTNSWIREVYNTLIKDSSFTQSHFNEYSMIQYLRTLRSLNSGLEDNCKMLLKKYKNVTLSNVLTYDLEKLIPSSLDGLRAVVLEATKNYVPNNILALDERAENFIDFVCSVYQYVQSLNTMYENDINYDANYERIFSSRFLIAVRNASSFIVQKSLRKIVEESGIPGVHVFNYHGSTIDIVDLVKSTTIYSTISTAIIVLIVALIFIPNVVCSLWIAFTIASVELGVLGFMALWSVKLNGVSMVNLIMCIGFSVDFSAHITYAYLNASGISTEEWLKEALYSVGLPIVLGGLSTIIGIIPIYFSESLIFLTFFKIVFLVIIFGILHSILFLPIFLSIIGPKNFGKYEIRNSDINSSQKVPSVFEISSSKFEQFSIQLRELPIKIQDES